MSTKLYVGNLPFDITEDDLRKMLSEHGPVNEIAVVMDKFTGRARGFAFATMNTQEAANAAILALNGKDFKGRALTVNEARPREERSGGGGVTEAETARALDGNRAPGGNVSAHREGLIPAPDAVIWRLL